MKHTGKTNPPGRIKIMKSFAALMKEKSFAAITTARIAADAGVTEGLIYKYFKDKRDLLYQVLNDQFLEFQHRIESRVSQEETCIGQLTVIIASSLESYAQNRVFARILLLEVRNSKGFFNSGAYAMIKKYAATILGIIQKGIETGELKPEIDPYLLRKVILGAIEHACIGEIIFGRELNVEKASAGIVDIVFNGVKA